MEILVPQGKGALSFIPRTVEAPLTCLQHWIVKDQRQTLHKHLPRLTTLGSGLEGHLVLPWWLHGLPCMELGWLQGPTAPPDSAGAVCEHGTVLSLSVVSNDVLMPSHPLSPRLACAPPGPVTQGLRRGGWPIGASTVF